LHIKNKVRSVGNVHIVLTEERGRKTICKWKTFFYLYFTHFEVLKTYSNTQHPT
ncbi:hypothetical protein T02_15397, partial [Trichinella nativa]